MTTRVVQLWRPLSPSTEDEPSEIRISLMDPRAADDLVIDYDFERDGYRIRMTATPDEEDERLVEVAFILAAAGRP